MLRYAAKKPCSLNLMPSAAGVSQQRPLQHQLPKSSIVPSSITGGRAVAVAVRPYSNSYRGAININVGSNVTVNAYPSVARTARRAFSAKPPPPPNNNPTDGKNAAGEPTSEIVLTPGQKVVAGTRLTMWAGVAALALTCSYYIGKELIPTKMSPNSIFDSAFSKIKEDDRMKRRFGDALKAYGRDNNGKREGRRNFIENSEYTDKDDGSKRVRVRFNLQGEHGNAFVFAEVSNKMPSGEFVYLMVQDRRNGQVINIIDNRSALMAKMMAGDDAKGQDAFANLMGVRK